jgi:FtsZ-interacting cell division protein ZipA
MRHIILKGFLLVTLLGVVIAPWAAEAAQSKKSATVKVKKTKAKKVKKTGTKKTETKKAKKTGAKSADPNSTKEITDYLKKVPLSPDPNYSSADLMESYLAGAKSAKATPQAVQAIAKRAKEELPAAKAAAAEPGSTAEKSSPPESEEPAANVADEDSDIAGEEAAADVSASPGETNAQKRIILNVKTDGTVDVVMPPKAKTKRK